MTLTVRLPEKLEQELAAYCTTHRVSRSEAVKRALSELLEPTARGQDRTSHPFIGCDEGDGTDVSGNIKQLLRERFRKTRR
jgi:Arc/MetJ-type ribon-helix-helix transcriptional regulator